MYNKQKNILLRLTLVGVWILDYYMLCPSHIVKLGSGQTPVEIYDGRGAKVVENLHADQH